jgi:hypothetical protein
MAPTDIRADETLGAALPSADWRSRPNALFAPALFLGRVHMAAAFRGGAAMPTCDQCGNDYDKAFQVTKAGRTMTFDSFECAIQALAPTCAHCGVRIVGHGVEEGGSIFCCAHCAKHKGATAVRDRA